MRLTGVEKQSINIGKAYLFAAKNGGIGRPSYLKRPEEVIA